MSVKLALEKEANPALTTGTLLVKGTANYSYLEAYLRQLQTNPLRTKVIAGGSLSGLQELLATWLSGEGKKNGTLVTSRLPKMAIYGAFVAAPLRHYLPLISLKLFNGKTGRLSKVLQLLVNSLAIPAVSNIAFLVSMAIIAGARSLQPLRGAVTVGFVPMMKVSVAVQTIAQAIAQNFLPPRLWAPYFNLVGLFVGTYFTTQAKRRRLAAAEAAKKLE